MKIFKKFVFLVSIMALLTLAILLPRVGGLDSIKQEIEEEYPGLPIVWFYESCEGYYLPGYTDVKEETININECVQGGLSRKETYQYVLDHEMIHYTGKLQPIDIAIFDSTGNLYAHFEVLRGLAFRGTAPGNESAVAAGYDEVVAYGCGEGALNEFTNLDDWVRDQGFSCAELLALRENPLGIQILCTTIFGHPERPCDINELMAIALYLGDPGVANLREEEIFPNLYLQYLNQNFSTDVEIGWEIP